MIYYTPCYYGEHTIERYKKSRQQISDIIRNSDTISMDIDLLFDKELLHFFDEIFCPEIVNANKEIIVFVKASKRTTLRKVWKSLRKYIIKFDNNITMTSKKYCFIIYG